MSRKVLDQIQQDTRLNPVERLAVAAMIEAASADSGRAANIQAAVGHYMAQAVQAKYLEATRNANTAFSMLGMLLGNIKQKGVSALVIAQARIIHDNLPTIVAYAQANPDNPTVKQQAETARQMFGILQGDVVSPLLLADNGTIPGHEDFVINAVVFPEQYAERFGASAATTDSAALVSATLADPAVASVEVVDDSAGASVASGKKKAPAAPASSAASTTGPDSVDSDRRARLEAARRSAVVKSAPATAVAPRPAEATKPVLKTGEFDVSGINTLREANDDFVVLAKALSTAGSDSSVKQAVLGQMQSLFLQLGTQLTATDSTPDGFANNLTTNIAGLSAGAYEFNTFGRALAYFNEQARALDVSPDPSIALNTDNTGGFLAGVQVAAGRTALEVNGHIEYLEGLISQIRTDEDGITEDSQGVANEFAAGLYEVIMAYSDGSRGRMAEGEFDKIEAGRLRALRYFANQELFRNAVYEQMPEEQRVIFFDAKENPLKDITAGSTRKAIQVANSFLGKAANGHTNYVLKKAEAESASSATAKESGTWSIRSLLGGGKKAPAKVDAERADDSDAASAAASASDADARRRVRRDLAADLVDTSPASTAAAVTTVTVADDADLPVSPATKSAPAASKATPTATAAAAASTRRPERPHADERARAVNEAVRELSEAYLAVTQGKGVSKGSKLPEGHQKVQALVRLANAYVNFLRVMGSSEGLGNLEESRPETYTMLNTSGPQSISYYIDGANNLLTRAFAAQMAAAQQAFTVSKGVKATRNGSKSATPHDLSTKAVATGVAEGKITVEPSALEVYSDEVFAAADAVYFLSALQQAGSHTSLFNAAPHGGATQTNGDVLQKMKAALTVFKPVLAHPPKQGTVFKSNHPYTGIYHGGESLSSHVTVGDEEVRSLLETPAVSAVSAAGASSADQDADALLSRVYILAAQQISTPEQALDFYESLANLIVMQRAGHLSAESYTLTVPEGVKGIRAGTNALASDRLAGFLQSYARLALDHHPQTGAQKYGSGDVKSIIGKLLQNEGFENALPPQEFYQTAGIPVPVKAPKIVDMFPSLAAADALVDVYFDDDDDDVVVTAAAAASATTGSYTREDVIATLAKLKAELEAGHGLDAPSLRVVIQAQQKLGTLYERAPKGSRQQHEIAAVVTPIDLFFTQQHVYDAVTRYLHNEIVYLKVKGAGERPHVQLAVKDLNIDELRGLIVASPLPVVLTAVSSDDDDDLDDSDDDAAVVAAATTASSAPAAEPKAAAKKGGATDDAAVVAAATTASPAPAAEPKAVAKKGGAKKGATDDAATTTSPAPAKRDDAGVPTGSTDLADFLVDEVRASESVVSPLSIQDHLDEAQRIITEQWSADADESVKRDLLQQIAAHLHVIDGNESELTDDTALASVRGFISDAANQKMLLAAKSSTSTGGTASVAKTDDPLFVLDDAAGSSARPAAAVSAPTTPAVAKQAVADDLSDLLTTSTPPAGRGRGASSARRRGGASFFASRGGRGGAVSTAKPLAASTGGADDDDVFGGGIAFGEALGAADDADTSTTTPASTAGGSGSPVGLMPAAAPAKDDSAAASTGGGYKTPVDSDDEDDADTVPKH